MYGEGFIGAWCGLLDFAIHADVFFEHAFFAKSGMDEFLSGAGQSACCFAILQQFADAIGKESAV